MELENIKSKDENTRMNNTILNLEDNICYYEKEIMKIVNKNLDLENFKS